MATHTAAMVVKAAAGIAEALEEAGIERY